MVQFSFSLLYAVLALSRMMSLNDTDHTKVIQIDIIIEMLVWNTVISLWLLIFCLNNI